MVADQETWTRKILSFLDLEWDDAEARLKPKNKAAWTDIDGKIDTGKGGGIRNTFQAVPDAPVSKFVLELKGGKKGLLVNSENICSKPQHATADFTGQNGKVYDTEPLIANSCGKKAKGKKSKKRGGKK